MATKKNRTAKPQNGKPKTAAVPDEPEEVRLWRRVTAFRDLLTTTIVNWEAALADQRAGTSPEAHAERAGISVDEISAEWLASHEELTKHSEDVFEKTIESNRVALDDLDSKISALRWKKGKTYGLDKLRKIADSFHDHLLTRAHGLVLEHLRDPSDESRRIAATSALLDVRDGEPRPPRSVLQTEGIALDALVADARAGRVQKNEYNSTVAERVVAAAAGLPPRGGRVRHR